MISSRKQNFSIQALQLLDASLVWLSFWVGSQLRAPLIDAYNHRQGRWLGEIFKQDVAGLKEITWLLFIVVPFTPLILEIFGFYRHPLRGKLSASIWNVLRSYTLLGLLIAALVIFFKFDTASRAVLIIAIPLSGIFLVLRDSLLRRLLRRRAANENLKESIVIAGTPEDTRAWLESLPAEDLSGWRVVAHHDLRGDDWDAFEKLLDDSAVERVIFAAANTRFESLATAIELCESRGVEAWVAAGFIQTQVARPTFDSLAGRPMLVLRSTPELSWEMLAKQVIDRAGAFLLLLCTSPVWLVAAIGIKIQSPGPVFYCQERAGKYGKPFRMWKFRTMVPDADKKLEEIKQQSGNQMSGPVFKLTNDPRIFPLGRFLRKYSIDEFPQLVNVLRGEMSLVGPRPMALYELPNIEKSAHRRKLSVKPGCTCIWQVSGRNQITDFDEWVKLDLLYIDNWSLWLDFRILLQTIPAVLFARGAK